MRFYTYQLGTENITLCGKHSTVKNLNSLKAEGDSVKLISTEEGDDPSCCHLCHSYRQEWEDDEDPFGELESPVLKSQIRDYLYETVWSK